MNATNGLTPVVLYDSAGMRVGPRAVVQIYRPTSAADTTGLYAAGVTPPNVAGVVAAGAEANTVGNPKLVEALGLDMSSSVMQRTGTFGEGLGDPQVVRGNPTLSLTIQMAANGDPTPCDGDYLNLNVGFAITSSPAAPASVAASRWVLAGVKLDTSGANKYTATGHLDRVNSSPALKEF